MDLNRLAMDLTAALEESRKHSARLGTAYIQPQHLLAVLLQQGGALQRLTASKEVPLDAATALASVEAVPLGGDAVRLEAGRQPVASRGLRDLFDRAFTITDRRGQRTVGVVEVALAAVKDRTDNLATALTDAGWTTEELTKLLDSPVVMQPAEAQAAVGGSQLERFARDLTQASRDGKLMPVIGRDTELRQVIQTLLRKSKNNPVLVGDPGTGKTAVAEALAQRIVAGDVPESLRGCRVMALDLTALVAGAKYRGEFEERIKAVVDEVRGSTDIILFLDEIHTLVGAGGSAGGMDAANILKPPLARGELRCIGATTHDEYRESIEKDGALARRFEKVIVDEPDDETTLIMLRGVKARYETHHGVRISEDALQVTVKLARRHLRDRFFPDKAFDILDESSANLRMQLESKPTEIDERERGLVRLQSQLEALKAAGSAQAQELEARVTADRKALDELLARWDEEKTTSSKLQETLAAIQEKEAALEKAEAAGDVAAAAEIQYGALKYLREQAAELEAKAAAIDQRGPLVPQEVAAAHVADVVARRARVPMTRMMESERDRLLKLEERLQRRVIGQNEAAAELADAARRMRADLRKKRKPASFLFVGPTGVGKTELAKALTEALFDDDTALIRIDMAEYKEAHSVSGLIGSRPGLVGYDEGGFLTEQVRRSPYSVVLFDEIEKAHPEVMDILLGVLDEGRLTDAKGRFCDFSNTLILLTSNLGVREANDATDDPAARKDIILKVVQASLRPELFNRLSGVIPFNSLETDTLEQIVRLHLAGLGAQLLEHHQAALEVDDDAVSRLAQLAYDPAYGARPVERTIDRMILSDLSNLIIGGHVVPDSVVRVVRDGDELVILAGTADEVATEAKKIGSAAKKKKGGAKPDPAPASQ